MTRFFTTAGDDGYTGLLGEGRVPKSDPKIEALGDLDEANAALGVARAACKDKMVVALLLKTQRDLYDLMAEVSATPENAARFRCISTESIAWLENQIDSISSSVDVPEGFIVPGDSPAGAALDLARTIVRRAERRLALLTHEKQVENPALLPYLNRLSSLCFVLELYENQAAGRDQPTLAKE